MRTSISLFMIDSVRASSTPTPTLPLSKLCAVRFDYLAPVESMSYGRSRLLVSPREGGTSPQTTDLNDPPGLSQRHDPRTRPRPPGLSKPTGPPWDPPLREAKASPPPFHPGRL